METGRELARLETGKPSASFIVFTSDGQTLLTGMNDGTILVWDVSAPDSTL